MTAANPAGTDPPGPRLVSVIIPVRNEAEGIGRTITAVKQQASSRARLEVVVVDDGSVDGTLDRALESGARVLHRDGLDRGNPGAARNLGARAASGDPLIFLDADCSPSTGWLDALLDRHDAGAEIVGGSLELPEGLSALARCDYYASAYFVHSRRRGGLVPNHPPANLSVRRQAFFSSAGFTERFPVADGHEELAWQAELRRAGKSIYFEPAAVAYHRNRPGLANLLRRNYRWGYSALESKASSGAGRVAWAYRYPRVFIAAAVPIAVVQAVHTLGAWLGAGRFEPLLMAPGIFAARLAYAAGVMVGGIKWMRAGSETREARPRWR